MNNTDPHSYISTISPTIRVKGRLLDLSKPLVMGILNITPDSFFDGGKFTELRTIINRAGSMMESGAAIIDIGAQSTRPGAKPVSEKEEVKRLVPAIDAIMNKYPDAIISVDTYRQKCAEAAIHAGACIINDVSAGDLDKNMATFVKEAAVPYIIMHMKGTPATMQKNPVYKNVVNEVLDYLGSKVAELRRAGISDIIIDPGFGFGKTVSHNYSLLKKLNIFNVFGCPVLAGLSRKSMICKVLEVKPEMALNGTTALNMLALQNGASILRVHDVKEAVECIKLYEQYRQSE